MTAAGFGLHPASFGTGPIAYYTGRLADLADGAGPSTPVRTCGDWTMAELVWHLTEVQDFWAWIIANRPAGPEAYPQPSRHDGALVENLRAVNAALVTALEAASTGEKAWSWHPEFQSVDFTWRRQSHEALIHCFDAVLAVDAPRPEVSSLLAADGFDELVTVVAGGVPEWATYHGSEDRLLVEAEDSGDHWNLEFGALSGTSPGGTTYDKLATLAVVDPSLPFRTRIGADALDLDLWGWGRGDRAQLGLEGDVALADRLQALVNEST